MLSQQPSTAPLILKAKIHPILVADPNAAFLESMWQDEEAQRIPPLLAQSGSEAKQILSDFKEPFSGIFINPDIISPAGLQIVRSAHHYQPGVPIFLICEENSDNEVAQLNEAELRNLGIQRIVTKPISYTELIKIVTPPTMLFDPKEALEIGRKNADPVGQEMQVDDSGFFPIRVSNFYSGTKSFFDIYVKLTSKRYVKILRAGDSFSLERVVSYAKKGIEHFYLKREAQEHYINYCDKLVAAILKSKKLSTDFKVAQTYHQGDETVDFLKSIGLTSDSLAYAQGFLSNVEELIKQLSLDQHKAIQPFLADITSYSHGVGVCMISALLVRALKMDGAKLVQTVGLGSLFHDIALEGLDMGSTQPGDEDIYRMHPITGGQVLQRVGGIDPVVSQIVAQHHERRNRNGFPRKLGPSAILQLSEIVGISDEFVDLLQAQKVDPTVEPFVRMLEIFEGFSPAVTQAFRDVFLSEAFK